MKVIFLLRPNYNSTFGGDVVQCEKLIEQLEKRGHECYRDLFKTRYDYKNKKYLLDQRAVDFKPDIALLFNKNHNQVMAARHIGCKAVLWCTVLYGWYASREQGIWQDHQEIAQNVDGMIFLGETERQYIKEWHDWSCPSWIVPNGVDIPKIGDVEHPFPGKPFLLFMGRIEPNKNALNLFHALKILGDRAPLTYIVGKPHGGKAYAKLVQEEADMVPQVKLKMGGVPHGMALDLMSIAYSCIQPSCFECAPLSTFEAAIMGANVIVTETSCAKDYLGNTAIYCNPSPQSIADAIQKSMNTKRNGQAGKAMSRFTWEYAGGLLEEVLCKNLK